MTVSSTLYTLVAEKASLNKTTCGMNLIYFRLFNLYDKKVKQSLYTSWRSLGGEEV
jgi:hypothetical protein